MQITHPTSSNAAYQPYSYATGIFQTYAQHARPHASIDRSPAAPNSAHHPTDGRYGDPSFSIESLLASGYLAMPDRDPITAPIHDKQQVSRLGLDDVIDQIRQRIALYQQNSHEIESAVCEAGNSVHRQVAQQGRPADNRQQYSAHKQVQKLYEQKRLERVNLWRDVSRLRLALPENVQSYLAATRKLSVLDASSDPITEAFLRGDAL